jgi:hypothetical protein
MWCTHCQQDVPGTVRPEDGRYGCSRCGNSFDDAGAAGAGTEHPGPGESESGAGREDCARSQSEFGPLQECDTWELEERLRHIERVLRIDKSEGIAGPSSPPGDGIRIRIDGSHQQPIRHRRARSKKKRTKQSPRPGRWLSTTTWGVLLLGVMTLACGGVLLGWSVVCGIEHLWSIGVPIALAGQILLLMGFVLQIDRLWHESSDTAAKLDDVDHRLDDLRNTTALLGNTHSPPGTSFYAHLAGGASPQILLADLKSQLDLLAGRIAEDRD